MTKSNKKLLVIWDFDGVIADSEKLWMQIWRQLLKKEKDIILTKDEELSLLFGMADRTKKHKLQKHFPQIQFDAAFMQKITDAEIHIGENFMEIIPGVVDILSDNHFDHCIATGSMREQLNWKINLLKLKSYIKPSDCFTVDMVEHGKPAPDLFLLAAKTKGYLPKNCIVIEDSISGIMAAKSAKMKCIAFLGAEGNDTSQYREKCLAAKADFICSSMQQVLQTLQQLI